jgi:hypothetical protein
MTILPGWYLGLQGLAGDGQLHAAGHGNGIPANTRLLGVHNELRDRCTLWANVCGGGEGPVAAQSLALHFASTAQFTGVVVKEAAVKSNLCSLQRRFYQATQRSRPLLLTLHEAPLLMQAAPARSRVKVWKPSTHKYSLRVAAVAATVVRGIRARSKLRSHGCQASRDWDFLPLSSTLCVESARFRPACCFTYITRARSTATAHARRPTDTRMIVLNTGAPSVARTTW